MLLCQRKNKIPKNFYSFVKRGDFLENPFAKGDAGNLSADGGFYKNFPFDKGERRRYGEAPNKIYH